MLLGVHRDLRVGTASICASRVEIFQACADPKYKLVLACYDSQIRWYAQVTNRVDQCTQALVILGA
jgi:hypothetical protein